MMQTNKLLYFRRKNKGTYALNFQKNVRTRALEVLMSKREGILFENIRLIHRGRVQESSGTLHQFPSKSIVHVIDMAEVEKDEIEIRIKRLDNTISSYNVNPQGVIQQFIKQKLARVDTLPSFYVGLIYAGKMLNPGKTFKEEYVENGCEVIMVDISNYINKKQQTDNKNSHGLISKQVQVQVQQEDKGKILKIVSLQTQGNSDQPQELSSPLFNIQVSHVDSISTQSNQHNLVSFTNQDPPFEDLASSLHQTNDEKVTKSLIYDRKALKQTDLSASDMIHIGQHQSRTKSFIDRLMKRYKLILN